MLAVLSASSFWRNEPIDQSNRRSQRYGRHQRADDMIKMSGSCRATSLNPLLLEPQTMIDKPSSEDCRGPASRLGKPRGIRGRSCAEVFAGKRPSVYAGLLRAFWVDRLQHSFSSNNFARTVSRQCSYRLHLPRAVNLKLAASMCTVTRRARNCGKALGAHNRTVEEQDTGPKIAKVGVKPLDDSDTTWLVVFRWCGWNHADRQVHSSSFIMGASLRPKGAAFPKDKPTLVREEATLGELGG